MKLFAALFYIFSVTAWILNVGQLTKCDFDPSQSWKGEVVHVLGVFTPTCYVTAWSNWDEKID